MSYIGRQPQIGNFQICDAISTVNNQAAYTMQVGSVNVSPESANHMIVSLNGVIQKPTDAFTVSGSTITFASNLVTGDVINFIQILGNVLDLGVPSDSTVSIAKLTATGTKNSTTFLRGDNTFATAGLTGVTTDSGNVTITDGNLTFGGAGHGVHLGVTSATAANLLDDYEKGTFTPSIASNAGYSSVGYGDQLGSYTKIGNFVYYRFRLNITSGSTNGNRIEVSGLPFTSASSPDIGSGASFSYAPPGIVGSVTTNLPTLWHASNNSKLSWYNTNGGSFVGSNLSSATIDFYINGVYQTA